MQAQFVGLQGAGREAATRCPAWLGIWVGFPHAKNTLNPPHPWASPSSTLTVDTCHPLPACPPACSVYERTLLTAEQDDAQRPMLVTVSHLPMWVAAGMGGGWAQDTDKGQGGEGSEGTV